jgi:hypothetical protein
MVASTAMVAMPRAYCALRVVSEIRHASTPPCVQVLGAFHCRYCIDMCSKLSILKPCFCAQCTSCGVSPRFLSRTSTVFFCSHPKCLCDSISQSLAMTLCSCTQLLLTCSTAGYYCPPGVGSISPTYAICTQGKYSLAGAGACLDCPAGFFGAATAMQTAGCSGTCPQGSTCPAGSSQFSLCPAGYYSVDPSLPCTRCAPGRYGSLPGLSSDQCSGLCAGGRYGTSCYFEVFFFSQEHRFR